MAYRRLLLVLFLCVALSDLRHRNLCQAITEEALVTDRVYLDLEIEGEPAGRVVIGLFGATSPFTVRNFIALATHEYGFGYRDTIFHRIISKFMMQGGDFTYSNGSGGYSIYGKYFNDEDFIMKHFGPGWVCMANAGYDTNGSQFYITVVKAPWIDGTHTCFGVVLKGMDLVYKASETATDQRDRPVQPVKILDSGSLPSIEPFVVEKKGVE